MAYTEVSRCVVSGVEVRKLRSTRTGLTVCLAQVEGPLVNGYFCLATEAHDHDGLPHTLEHLVFMGSEEYPYKGVLDMLSNRCLAQGTNAWTDVDHTCYTVTTAGSEGFLNLLPIYLDHILYPTLTDSAYVTEVHHVNGQGEDAGVVYCEMQARENTPESLSIFQLYQDMYPGRCGYKSETGGLMKNLRESTSNKKVRDYHRSYYRHDNMCLIVTGQVDPDKLFKTLQPFEDKIVSKSPLPAMARPWQSPVPPLTDTVTRDISFPTAEMEDGIVRVCVRGPSALDRYAMAAAGVVMEYLSDTPVAPIQQDLVEIEDPFCSDVEQIIVENREVLLGFTLQGVPVDKLDVAPKKVLDVLEGIANGKEAIDEERMTAIIKRQILNIHNQVEEVPHEFFAFTIIGDFLFGDSPGDFPSYLNQEPRLRQLLSEPPSFWTALVGKYFIKGPHVIVCGRPDSELAVSIQAQEASRVAERVQQWGEGGLKERARIVEEACQQNEIPAPTSLTSSLSVPGIESIVFHPLSVAANYMTSDQLPPGVGMAVEKLPFVFQLNQIHSGFVQLTAILDTAALSQEERLYLPLYQELLFESPLLRKGELLPYEAVVNQLNADTVQFSAGLGLDGGRFKTGKYSQALFISIKVEVDKYSTGVQWLKDILYNVQFSTERVGVVTSKMLNDVPRLKRKGNHVTRTLHQSLLYTASANANLTNMSTQHSFLTALKERSGGEVLGDITRLRDKLVSPNNLRVVMGTDVNRLSDPLEPWKDFTAQPSSVPPASMPSISPSKQFLKDDCIGRAVVAGVTGVESNFLIQSTEGVDCFTHPDYPAILVFMEYLCALEGPMWRQIRGMGLSYHYSMSASPESGKLTFVLYKSSQLVRAYEVAMEIMGGFVSGSTLFEMGELEAAISGVIYETIQREKTVSSCEQEATLNYIKQLEQSYNKKLLSLVAKVTVDDLKRVGGAYFTRLFDHAHTTTAVCCNPSKVTEVKEGLEKCGLNVECLSNLSELSAI